MVALLVKTDLVVPALQDLGNRHAGYGMKDQHYASTASAFLWTLNQLMGEEFAPQIGEAWTEAFNTMVEVMRDGSAKAADAHVGLLSTNQQDKCKYFAGAFYQGQ